MAAAGMSAPATRSLCAPPNEEAHRKAKGEDSADGQHLVASGPHLPIGILDRGAGRAGHARQSRHGVAGCAQDTTRRDGDGTADGLCGLESRYRRLSRRTAQTTRLRSSRGPFGYDR